MDDKRLGKHVEPTRYLSTLRRGWLWLLIGALAGLFAAGGYTSTRTPQYTATSSVFFSVAGGDSSTQLLQGSTFSQNQVRSYALLATMPVVLQPVIDDLGLTSSTAQLAAQINTTTPPETVVLEISVTDPDPNRAAAVANAVTTQLSETVASLSSDDTPGTPADPAALKVKATTVAAAGVPTKPSSPNWPRNLALGFFGGMALAAGFVVLRELLNTKVKTEADVARVDPDMAVLGLVSHDPGVKKHPVLDIGDRGGRAESLRRLRSNLEYLNYDGRLRSLVITSALPNEGKTMVSVNLALTMAESQRVVLIDADLRNPSVGDLLGLEGSVGLSTVLSGQISAADAIQGWGRGRLDVITAGQIPPNPSELLGSQAMAKLLESLLGEGGYDIVLLDTAPILPVSDSTVLSKFADGAIVVASAKVATRHQLGQALRAFSRSGARILGVVLNQTHETHDGYYYGSYGQSPSTVGDVVAPPAPAGDSSAIQPPTSSRIP